MPNHDAVSAPAANRWNDVVLAMLQAGSIGAMVRELAMQAQCVAVDDAAAPPCWVLQVERETLRAEAHRAKLQAALALHLGHGVALQVRAGVAADTPALRSEAERERRQREAEDLIRNDPVVRDLMAQYSGARIVPGSVKYQ
jgi:DNA polymerase III subunit gamma/tau